MNRRLKVIVISLTAVIFGLLAVLLFVSFIINPYTHVVVAEQQFTNVKINGVEYYFAKDKNVLSISPWDQSHYPTNAIVLPQEGQTYRWLGINITIVEVHVDRYVLSIKSNGE